MRTETEAFPHSTLPVPRAAVPLWRRRSLRRRLPLVGTNLVILIGAFVVSIPLLWMLSTSVKDPGDVFLQPPQWIPSVFRWANYAEAVNAIPFWTYTTNSIIITALGVIGEVVSCSLVAYAFARLRSRDKDVLFLILLSTMMLPGEVKLVPTYLMFRWFGWLNTFLPLVVPHFFGGAFYIFLLRQFFLTLPLEMDEAAKVDGAGYLRIFWNIILPLAKPALATVAIFSFYSIWNDFLSPLIYLSKEDNYTLPLGLQAFIGAYGVIHWTWLMAASVLALIPCVVIFFTFQRWFIEGAVLSGLKG